MTDRKIYVAIPAMNEGDYLDACLEAIDSQTYKNYEVFICVNQPDAWWHNETKKNVCIANEQTIKALQKRTCHVIDKSSKGCGWDDKRYGVGWARKVLMDTVNRAAKETDIILSLDADTLFDAFYFSSIIEVFRQAPQATALSNPYYHKLTGIEKYDRPMLRYEIYMRYYALNLWHIQSPYAFTALGSAIAVSVSVYRKIGGITPKKSGEDFYFLQKLRKFGHILTWNTRRVYPSSRFSDRVFFGTGPALIKGHKGIWDSYPLYPRQLFDHLAKTYELFIPLYNKNIPTPIDGFLEKQFGNKNIWNQLRSNTNTSYAFVKACHQKIDGLRILQYLKSSHKNICMSDEEALIDFLNNYYPDTIQKALHNFCFSTAPVSLLNSIRNFLAEKEALFQKKNFDAYVKTPNT